MLVYQRVIYVCISSCAIQFDVLQSTGLSGDVLKLVKKCFPCCSCTAWHQRTLGQNTGVSIHPVSGSIWRFNMLSHVTRCYKYHQDLSNISCLSNLKKISQTIQPDHSASRSPFCPAHESSCDGTATAMTWCDLMTVATPSVPAFVQFFGFFPGSTVTTLSWSQFISVSLSQFPNVALIGNLPSAMAEDYHSIHQFFVKSCNSTLHAFRILWSWNPDLTSFNIIQHIHLIWLVSPIGSILLPYSNLQYLHDLIWFCTILHLHVQVCKWDTQLSRARHWAFCRRGSLFRTTCVWPLSEHVGICRNGLWDIRFECGVIICISHPTFSEYT